MSTDRHDRVWLGVPAPRTTNHVTKGPLKLAVVFPVTVLAQPTQHKLRLRIQPQACPSCSRHPPWACARHAPARVVGIRHTAALAIVTRVCVTVRLHLHVRTAPGLRCRPQRVLRLLRFALEQLPTAPSRQDTPARPWHLPGTA